MELRQILVPVYKYFANIKTSNQHITEYKQDTVMHKSTSKCSYNLILSGMIKPSIKIGFLCMRNKSITYRQTGEIFL